MGMTNELAEEEADRIMRTLDTNGNGTIDYSGNNNNSRFFLMVYRIEFVNATISTNNILKKERLEAAFKMFDKVIKR